MRVMRFLQSMSFLPFVPDPSGRHGAKGGRSQGKRTSFSEDPGQIVCAVQKAQPAIWSGNRNPEGLELASEAAERGNYPEAKPNEPGHEKADELARRINSLMWTGSKLR